MPNTTYEAKLAEARRHADALLDEGYPLLGFVDQVAARMGLMAGPSNAFIFVAAGEAVEARA